MSGDPRAWHGGRGISAKRRAEEKFLADHVHETIGTVYELSKKPEETPQPCPMCGRGLPESEKSKETRLKAAIAFTDRAGFGPHSTVNVNDAADHEWLEYATSEEAAQVLEIIDRCRSRMPVNDAPPADEEARVN